MQQAKLEQKWQEFLRNCAKTLEDIDYEGWSEAYFFLYPDTITALLDDIFLERDPIFTWDFDSCNLEFVMTNRIGATEVLCYALGWERASRLPGYFGNLFIPPSEVAEALRQVKAIFSEVDADEFIEKAKVGAVMCCEEIAPKLASILPSALKTVLREGNGLLALTYPDVGAIPCIDDYEND